jgi:hypothetical protein
MRIERVQYDGEGQWLDVVFDDGKRARFPALLVRKLAEIAVWGAEDEREEKPSGVLSIGVGLERIRELLPAYEKCDGFGCAITLTGIHHGDDCSQKEQASS